MFHRMGDPSFRCKVLGCIILCFTKTGVRILDVLIGNPKCKSVSQLLLTFVQNKDLLLLFVSRNGNSDLALSKMIWVTREMGIGSWRFDSLAGEGSYFLVAYPPIITPDDRVC